MTVRVLVCGGRAYFDRARVWSVLDHYHAESGGFECVIHGNGPGADRTADEWANARGVRVLPFPAEWDLYGKRAGPIRNEKMLTEGRPTVVIAFPGDIGTADMIRQSERAGVPVIRVPA